MRGEIIIFLSGQIGQREPDLFSTSHWLCCAQFYYCKLWTIGPQWNIEYISYIRIMKSLNKCRCSPVLSPVPAHRQVWGNCCQFLKIGQFEILQPPPAGQMFLQLYGSDKHINQSILTGRHEQSGPWFDHQSFFLAQKSIANGAWKLSLLVYNCFLQCQCWSILSLITFCGQTGTSSQNYKSFPAKVAENWQGRNTYNNKVNK